MRKEKFQRGRTKALWGMIDLVVAGTLPLNERTSEAWIAEQLGLSRMPVREALAILARDEVVVQRAQVGVWFLPVSEKEITQLTKINYQIELLALDRLLEQPKDDVESQLDRCLWAIRQQERHVHKTQDPLALDSFLQLEGELHGTICDLGGIVPAVQTIYVWMIKRRLYHLEHPPESTLQLAAEDERLIRVLVGTSDRAEARSALRRYFEYILTTLQPLEKAVG